MRTAATLIAALTLASILSGQSPPEKPKAAQAKAAAPKVYSTPQEVFEAFRTARAKGDTRTYYYCRLPEHREYLTFEFYLACSTQPPASKALALPKKFGLDEQAVEEEICKLYKAKHGVDFRKIVAEWDAKNRQAAATGKSISNPPDHGQELLHKALNNLVTDRIGFLAAVEAELRRPERPFVMGNLRNLRITGDKAVGESTHRMYTDPDDPGAKGRPKWQEYRTTIEFKKTKEGWFISKG